MACTVLSVTIAFLSLKDDNMNIQVIIDTQEVKDFINNKDFINFLLTNTNLATSSFILQVLQDKLEEIENK